MDRKIWFVALFMAVTAASSVHAQAIGLPEISEQSKECIECHKIASEMPKKDVKAMREKKAKKKEIKTKKLEYHAEALHYNCRGCHRLYNKKYKPTTKAPTTCVKCHPKKKK